MIEIRPLGGISADDLQRLITGYVSDARYRAYKTESAGEISMRLELIPLSQPYRKKYDHLDAETLARYQDIVSLGFSFAACDCDTGRYIGLALGEPQQWNKCLWGLELHVAEEYRGKGIGGKLVEALVQKGKEGDFRTIVCETQTTNVPAIHFYQRRGFTIDGIDLSYYSNNDFPDGEIALFMKKRIA